MKSTLAKLKNLTFKFKGKVRIPWAERGIDDYMDFLAQTNPTLARKLERLPCVKFHGAPHETEATKDPWHASAAFRRKEDFKGSGLSLHIYPDGTVVPSKADFPTFQGRAATIEDVGQDNSRWLDQDYIAIWQEGSAQVTTLSDGRKRDKGKGQDHDRVKDRDGGNSQRSAGSSSSRHGSAGKSNPNADGGGSSEGKGKGKAASYAKYQRDPSTGMLWRAEKGVVLYLDTDRQREYYYDRHGQPKWV